MQAVRVAGCLAPAAARHHAPQRQRQGRLAAPLLLAPRRHAQLLAPCRAMSDDDEEDLEVEEQQQQAAPAPAPVQQADEQTSASVTAEAAPAASARQTTRQAKRGVAAAPAVAEPDMGQAWRMGLGGVAALAAVAGLGFLGHRLSKSKAMTDAVSNVQQVGGLRVQERTDGGATAARLLLAAAVYGGPTLEAARLSACRSCWLLAFKPSGHRWSLHASPPRVQGRAADAACGNTCLLPAAALSKGRPLLPRPTAMQSIQKGQLAKESQQRLNEFMSTLRNMQVCTVPVRWNNGRFCCSAVVEPLLAAAACTCRLRSGMAARPHQHVQRAPDSALMPAHACPPPTTYTLMIRPPTFRRKTWATRVLPTL